MNFAITSRRFYEIVKMNYKFHFAKISELNSELKYKRVQVEPPRHNKKYCLECSSSLNDVEELNLLLKNGGTLKHAMEMARHVQKLNVKLTCNLLGDEVQNQNHQLDVTIKSTRFNSFPINLSFPSAERLQFDYGTMAFTRFERIMRQIQIHFQVLEKIKLEFENGIKLDFEEAEGRFEIANWEDISILDLMTIKQHVVRTIRIKGMDSDMSAAVLERAPRCQRFECEIDLITSFDEQIRFEQVLTVSASMGVGYEYPMGNVALTNFPNAHFTIE